MEKFLRSDWDYKSFCIMLVGGILFFVIGVSCILAYFIVDFCVVMEELLKIISLIENHVTAVIAAVTALAVTTSYIIRFFRAQHLGVVSRFSFVSFYDSIEFFAELVAIALFGVVFPVLLLNYENSMITGKILALCSITLIYMAIFVTVMARWRNFLGEKIYNRVKYLSIVLSIISASIVFFGLYNFWKEEPIEIAAVIFAIHLLVVLFLLARCIILRLTGNYYAENTCVIDGEMYLVGLRHTNNEWFLLRCRLDATEGVFKTKKSIIVTPGEYVVKNLKEVGIVKARTGYKVRIETNDRSDGLRAYIEKCVERYMEKRRTDNEETE